MRRFLRKTGFVVILTLALVSLLVPNFALAADPKPVPPTESKLKLIAEKKGVISKTDRVGPNQAISYYGDGSNQLWGNYYHTQIRGTGTTTLYSSYANQGYWSRVDALLNGNGYFVGSCNQYRYASSSVCVVDVNDGNKNWDFGSQHEIENNLHASVGIIYLSTGGFW